MPRLLIRPPDGVEHAFELSPEGAVIGRGAGCEVRLPERAVSLRHAKIILEGAEPLLVDLESTNGTLLNKRALPAGGRAPLREGDVLEVGPYRITFSSASEGETEPPEELARRLAREAISRSGGTGASLLVMNGPQVGLRAALSEGQRELVIGRGEDCDLRLVDADVSRRHAALRSSFAGSEIVDLGSRYGTVVDGERLPKDGVRRLRDRSELVIGQTRLSFSDPEEALLASLDQAEISGALRPPAAPLREEPRAVPSTLSREEPQAVPSTPPRWTALEVALLALSAGAFFFSAALLVAAFR